MSVTRRQFIQRGAAAAAAPAILAAAGHTAPSHANQPAIAISPAQWSLIEALAEAIVPGSRSAGLTAFLQRQLANPPEQALLMVRYLGLPVTPIAFYEGLAEQLSAVHGSVTFDAHALQAQMATDSVAIWQGLPASLYHFVLRSDGCDVVYGTPAGSKLLGLDYLAHIAPPEFL